MTQDKLNTRQYGNLTALESDLKRMVQNAKEFNTTSSKIYEDAERLRKALSNFMPKHNPAYKDPEYRAVPTPIPGGSEEEIDASQSPINTVDTPTAPTIKLRMNGSGSRRNGNGNGNALKAEIPVAGNDETMQQEQVKIVEEMIELRDPELVARNVCVVLNACNGLLGAVIPIQKSPSNSTKSLLNEHIPTTIDRSFIRLL
jgi:Bromodomain